MLTSQRPTVDSCWKYARQMAPSGPTLANDPRFSSMLRWSAGVCSALSVALLLTFGGLLVSLRDDTRELRLEMRAIAKSDNKQETDIERLTQRDNDHTLKLSDHGNRLRAVEARLNLR